MKSKKNRDNIDKTEAIINLIGNILVGGYYIFFSSVVIYESKKIINMSSSFLFRLAGSIFICMFIATLLLGLIHIYEGLNFSSSKKKNKTINAINSNLISMIVLSVYSFFGVILLGLTKACFDESTTLGVSIFIVPVIMWSLYLIGLFLLFHKKKENKNERK